MGLRGIGARTVVKVKLTPGEQQERREKEAAEHAKIEAAWTAPDLSRSERVILRVVRDPVRAERRPVLSAARLAARLHREGRAAAPSWLSCCPRFCVLPRMTPEAL